MALVAAYGKTLLLPNLTKLFIGLRSLIIDDEVTTICLCKTQNSTRNGKNDKFLPFTRIINAILLNIKINKLKMVSEREYKLAAIN